MSSYLLTIKFNLPSKLKRHRNLKLINSTNNYYFSSIEKYVLNFFIKSKSI